MVSRQSKEALNALVERTSRLTLLSKLDRNTSASTSEGRIQAASAPHSLSKTSAGVL